MATSTHQDNSEIRQTVYCLDCGYNLRGLTGAACPECGNQLAAMRSTVSQIPWTHRRGKSRSVVYWRTVRFAMFRQRDLANEMARDVSYGDAQRFRFVTLLHVIVPVVVLALSAYLIDPPRRIAAGDGVLRGFPPASSLTHWVYAAGWPVAVLIGALAVALTAATGVTSYFFQPRDMPVHLQNRAIALSYYASAPLAWTFIPLTLGLMGWSWGRTHETVGWALLLSAFMLFVVELGVWWSDSVRLLRRTMPRHKHHVRAAAIALPILWVVLFAAVFGVTSLVVIYIAVVVETLR